MEAEFALQPTDNMEMILGIGLIDTEISAPANITISGRPVDWHELPNTPGVNVNGVVRYSFPENLLIPGLASIQVDFRWQDDIFFDVTNEILSSHDSYGIVNLRAAWRSPEDKYEVSAFVENVTDEEYFIHKFSDKTALPFNIGMWGKPRWAGIKLGVNF